MGTKAARAILFRAERRRRKGEEKSPETNGLPGDKNVQTQHIHRIINQLHDHDVIERRGVAAQVNGLREWKEVEKLLALATTALFVWPLCPLLIAARPSLLRECEI